MPQFQTSENTGKFYVTIHDFQILLALHFDLVQKHLDLTRIPGFHLIALLLTNCKSEK